MEYNFGVILLVSVFSLMNNESERINDVLVLTMSNVD